MTSPADTNPKYWSEYSHLQRVKHELVRAYLGGWFAKLGSWAGRVVYFDTHAGRGIHTTGDLGSPLVALDTLLSHSHLSRLLTKSEFRFFFIERDETNLAALKSELKSRTIPTGVFVNTKCGDAFEILTNLVQSIKKMAPAFVFVDPYGFKVPGHILRTLMKAGRVELFVNVIWRELDMAIQQGKSRPGLTATLDSIFDGPDWKTEIDANGFDERGEQAVRLLAQKIGAKWHTYIRMLGDNGATRYLLVHFSNHDDGRDLMKDCIWKVAPNGGFYVRKSTDPGQQFLITPEPDLKPLYEWVVARLSAEPRRWQALLTELRPELWRGPHLNEVVRELRRDGHIHATDFTGAFSLKSNPVLRLKT